VSVTGEKKGVKSLLVEVMLHLVLVLEQPVDDGFVFHRLADHLGGRLSVGREQSGSDSKEMEEEDKKYS
jgi:hypothetical protein